MKGFFLMSFKLIVVVCHSAVIGVSYASHEYE